MATFLSQQLQHQLLTTSPQQQFQSETHCNCHSHSHSHNKTYNQHTIHMKSFPIQRRTPISSRSGSFEGKAMLPTGTAINKKLIQSPPTLTPDRVDRTSFSSVKETDTGIAQSFTDSKTSSYLRNEFFLGGVDGSYDEVVFDDASLSSGSLTPPEESSGNGISKRKLADSRLLGFVCPCDGFRGWKDISVRGKVASKSFGDLRSLGRWDWEISDEEVKLESTAMDVQEDDHSAGQSPIESLPMELLGAIIDQLATDIPPNGFTARNIDLMSLLLTSRSMHSATLSTLYNQITIPHSRIFRKFLAHISEHPALGTIVRRLDFSHFNPTGAGQTARERAQTQNLTQSTLLQCLNLTPNLREFLAQEHVDDELSTEVLKLLFALPTIKALDFCACSSPNFRDSFTAALEGLPESLPVTRLSLHECPVLPASIFATLLSRLQHLTHLDVAHTRITDEALFSIPHTARLSHLNISKCASLTGSAVVDFLTNHPAAKELVYLNISVDVKSHELLTSEDISALLPILPDTLRSLNMKGSKMDKSHIDALLPLTKHVEELGLGRHLNLRDITKLFIPTINPTEDDDAEAMEIEAQLSWIPHALRYIDVSDLNSSELDLGSLFSTSCPVLQSTARPLEVLELSPEVYKKLEKSQAALKRAGWCVKEAGRRGWLVRVKKDGDDVDSGARGWKLGASFWGMRKIPVARAEVGGMYGHYMFKR